MCARANMQCDQRPTTNTMRTAAQRKDGWTDRRTYICRKRPLNAAVDGGDAAAEGDSKAVS